MIKRFQFKKRAWANADGVRNRAPDPLPAALRRDPVRDRLQQLHHADGRGPRRRAQGRRRTPSAEPAGGRRCNRFETRPPTSSLRISRSRQLELDAGIGRHRHGDVPVHDQLCSESSSSPAGSRARRRSEWNERPSQRTRPGCCLHRAVPRRSARPRRRRPRRRRLVPRRPQAPGDRGRLGARRRARAPRQPGRGRRARRRVRRQERRRSRRRAASPSSRPLSPSDTIRVHAQKPMPGFFAKAFGIDSVNVGANASARSGVPSAAKWAAPIAVDELHPLLQCTPLPCFDQQTTLDLEKVGPGAFRLVNIDGSHGGTGPGILADWITRGYDGWMPLNWYFSDSGAKFNSSQVKGALDARIGDELLFPVYRDTRSNGANFEYEVVGWVGFHLTGYNIQGSKKNQLHGWFTRIIWEGILERNRDRRRLRCARRHASRIDQINPGKHPRQKTRGEEQAAMTYRVRNIAIAVALAVVAALLTTFYVTNYKKSVQSGEEAVTVFVAARDIPIGTSGSDVIDRKWIRSEEINRRNVVPGAISDPDADRGAVRRPAAVRGRAGQHEPLPAARGAGPARPAQGQRPRPAGSGRRAPAAASARSSPATASTWSARGSSQRARRSTSAASSCATCSSCALPTRARSRARSRAAPTCRSRPSSPSPTARPTSCSG